MVLTFTGSLSVAEAGRDDVRTMLIGALGCNLAWGIIDGVLYLMGCLGEEGRALLAFRAVRKTANPEQARRIVTNALPPVIASVLEPAELEAMSRRLQALPEPPGHVRLRWDDWLGATANFIAIALLFLTGYAFGRMTGRRPPLVGVAMVVLGAILVGLTKALGG